MTRGNLANFREWTANEVRTATALFRNLTRDGYSKKDAFAAVAERIGRSQGATRTRYYYLNESFEGKIPYVPKKKPELPVRQLTAHKLNPVPFQFRIPESVLTERERRNEALDARDLTQSFCGDPPPGFSMLDRQR